MPFERFVSTIRLATAAGLFAMLSIACWAQEPPVAPTPQNTPEARKGPTLNYAKPLGAKPAAPPGPAKSREHGTNRPTHARRQALPVLERRHCPCAGEQSGHRNRALQPEYRRHRG